MKNIKIYVSVLMLFVGTFVAAKNTDVALTKEEQTLMQELMVKTKVDMVLGSGLKAETDFQSDGDPMTLEVVVLDKDVGTDHVSDDGEIIFTHEKTKPKAMQILFTTAFYLKTKRQLAAKSQSSQSSVSSTN